MLISRKRGKSRVSLAMVGCGAVAELCHLPAVKNVREVEIVALADKNIVRAKELGERFGIPYCTADYHELPASVDGVIIGLPNYMHAPVAMEFLQKGIAVLVEKPMALTVEEAEAMVKGADVNGVALQVGLMYRFSQGARLVKRAVDEGWLGKVQSFCVEWGIVYDWPVASGFIFSKEQAGGGDLVDMGSHMLNLVLWWIGKAVDVEYRDDSLGGVEADCSVSLILQGLTGPVQGTVALSRLRKLSDTARVVGERFTIEYDLRTPARVRIWPSTPDGKDFSFILERQSWEDAYAEQLRAFAQAIVTGGKSVVSGESVIDTVDLIERCYRERKPQELPWMKPVVPTQQQVA